MMYKNQLNIRLSIGLVLLSLILWSTYGFVTHQKLLDSEGFYSSLINIAGKQRMLSQRIALQSLKQNPQLSETISEMMANHQIIINSATESSILDVYFKKPLSIDQKTRDFLRLAQSYETNPDNATLQSILLISNSLLPELDAAVLAIEKEADKKILSLINQQKFIFNGTVITLFLELLLIVLPLLKTVETLNKNNERERNRFKNIIDMASDAHAIIRPEDGKLLSYSKQMQKYLGYSNTEMQNLTVLDWDRDIQNLGEFESITRRINKNPVKFERTHTRKDGSSFPVSITAVRINLDDQEIFSVLQRDISDEKKLKTLSIEKAQKNTMDNMIAMIAHQWKQPLTIFKSSMSIIERALLKTPSIPSETQKTIENRTQHCVQLVDQMNSTIDDFRMFFNRNRDKTHYSLNCVIEKIFEMNRHANQQIDYSLTGPEIQLLGFESDLHNIIANLVKNSVDALIENEISKPKIHIHLTHTSHDSIEVQVQDNGGGIPPDMMPTLFDAYSTSKGLNGTGLGLYMTRLIIENHLQGRIVASNDSEGAIFKITFNQIT